MYPYDPATPDGVYFSFMDVMYETDRGEYNLEIEYDQSLSVNSSIWLSVLGSWPPVVRACECGVCVYMCVYN